MLRKISTSLFLLLIYLGGNVYSNIQKEPKEIFTIKGKMPRLDSTIKNGKLLSVMPAIFEWPSEQEIQGNRVELPEKERELFLNELKKILNPEWFPEEIDIKEVLLSLKREIPNRLPPYIYLNWLQYSIGDYVFRIYGSSAIIDVAIKKRAGKLDLFSLEDGNITPEILEVIVKKFFNEHRLENTDKEYKNWDVPKVDFKRIFPKSFDWANFWTDGEIIWFRFILPQTGKIGIRLPKEFL